MNINKIYMIYKNRLRWKYSNHHTGESSYLEHIEGSVIKTIIV